VKVIYPFTAQRTEESFISVMRYVPYDQLESVNVSTSEFEYGHLLEKLWVKQEDFLIIEHDIVIHEGLVEEFAECEEEWCSSPYTYFDQPVTTSGGGLGCTKFSIQLMYRWPTLMQQANALPCQGHSNGHWCTRDWAIYQLLCAGGSFASQYPAKRHQTHTPVGHRAGPCAHGCKVEL
jgi:hypothetical protein